MPGISREDRSSDYPEGLPTRTSAPEGMSAPVTKTVALYFTQEDLQCVIEALYMKEAEHMKEADKYRRMRTTINSYLEEQGR